MSPKPGYYPAPQTVEEFAENVEFQLANVLGWISASRPEDAAIKAKCLVEAAVALSARLESEPEVIQFRERIAADVARYMKDKGGVK